MLKCAEEFMPGIAVPVTSEVVALLNRRLDAIGQLSPVCLQFAAALADPEFPLEKAVKIVGADPVLAATVLRVVNSPAFGLRVKVAELGRAISLLGYLEVKNLAMRAYVCRAFKGSLGALGDKLWQHAHVASVAAFHLAQAFDPGVRGVASTAALLHDVGRIAIAHLALAEFRRLETSYPDEDSVERLKAEEQLLGANHCVIGALLAKRWNLADELRHVIGYHALCHLREPSGLPEEHRTLLMLTHCADLGAHWLDRAVQENPAAPWTVQWELPEAYAAALFPRGTHGPLIPPEGVRQLMRSKDIASV
ncbi:MAG: HDOD domain-containing protein [Armatimonadota bacterium]